MPIEYRRIDWWYWVATIALLGLGLSGETVFFWWAIGLTVVQMIHFSFRDRTVTSFSVQVRAGILLLFLVALLKPVIFWIPVVGISIRLLTGYCFLARVLSLLPWNRNEKLTGNLLRRTFLTPPVSGSILKNR